MRPVRAAARNLDRQGATAVPLVGASAGTPHQSRRRLLVSFRWCARVDVSEVTTLTELIETWWPAVLTIPTSYGPPSLRSYAVIFTTNSHAVTTPPQQARDGEIRSQYPMTLFALACPARRLRMSISNPDETASSSSSTPKATRGWGEAMRSAIRTAVMNRHKDCAARELRFGEAVSRSLLIETATNRSPVSAPAMAPNVAAKPRPGGLVVAHVRPFYPSPATCPHDDCLAGAVAHQLTQTRNGSRDSDSLRLDCPSIERAGLEQLVSGIAHR